MIFINSLEKIKEIIKNSGKTQKELSELLNVSKRTLENKLYRGGFSIDELIKIADCLGYKLAFVNDEEQIIFDMSSATAIEA